VREKPDPLQIFPEEAKFVDDIAELLSDRPRALKRFVNTYRLLKASLPDVERTTFVTAEPSSPHRVCLIQLAFFTSHPRLASDLVARLKPGAPNTVYTPQPGRTKVLRNLGTWLDITYEKDSALRVALEAIPASSEISVEEFQRWLPLTSRYLFHRAN